MGMVTAGFIFFAVLVIAELLRDVWQHQQQWITAISRIAAWVGNVCVAWIDYLYTGRREW